MWIRTRLLRLHNPFGTMSEPNEKEWKAQVGMKNYLEKWAQRNLPLVLV